jgi:hypothetical protein
MPALGIWRGQNKQPVRASPYYERTDIKDRVAPIIYFNGAPVHLLYGLELGYTDRASLLLMMKVSCTTLRF